MPRGHFGGLVSHIRIMDIIAKMPREFIRRRVTQAAQFSSTQPYRVLPALTSGRGVVCFAKPPAFASGTGGPHNWNAEQKSGADIRNRENMLYGTQDVRPGNCRHTGYPRGYPATLAGGRAGSQSPQTTPAVRCSRRTCSTRRMRGSKDDCSPCPRGTLPGPRP